MTSLFPRPSIHPLTRLIPAAALAALLCGLTPAAWAAASSVRATVNGMVCAFCAQGIEKRLSKLPAAQAVYVDLKRRVVAVEAKPGQALDPQAIQGEIRDAGYDVVKLETLAQSVAEIRAATQAAPAAGSGQ